MKLLWCILLLCYLDCGFSSPHEFNDYKLEQLQLLFRHGDRVPEKQEIYETDPYDSIFQNLGYGQLTKIGMRRMYEIGQILRERYGFFLREYKPEDIYAYSTNYDRTKMSLQLVLAGLYPPSLEDAWSDSIRWSPIPSHYDLFKQSIFMTFYCPAYNKMLTEEFKLPEYQSKAGYERYGQFYEYLKSKTGLTIENPFSVCLMLHNNLRASLSLGLPLPDWCSRQDLEVLKNISAVYLDAMVSTEAMRKIITGPMIERFLENVNGEGKYGDRKLHVYSAHDVNIAVFTRAHSVAAGVPEYPEYGSAIVIEKLRGPDDRVYLRIFMWTGVSKKWIPLKVAGCETICPLSRYTKIVQPILPDALARQCTSLSTICESGQLEERDSISEELKRTYMLAGDDLFSFKHMKDPSYVQIIHGSK